jgi:asparagine synthase (glutamine-hydrolysing)
VDTEAPIRLVRHVWAAANAVGPADRMLAHDAKFLLADRALPAVSRSCELAGAEAIFPLLADDLAGLVARLRADTRLSLALRAPAPAAGGLPLDEWLRTHRGLQQLAGDTLSSLKGRGIFRPGFVDEAVKLHRSGQETSAGAMIFRLMMLEQWFRVHAREPAPVG